MSHKLRNLPERYTARELGAVIAHACAVNHLRKLKAESQLDLFRDVRAERREWVRILGTAVEARAHG